MKQLIFCAFILLSAGNYLYADRNSDREYVMHKMVDQYMDGNYTTAAKLAKVVCDMGETDGCNSLGIFYTNGTGVKKSISKAKELFKKSCDLGNSKGCKLYDEIEKKKF